MSAQAARMLRGLPVLRRWPLYLHSIGLRTRIALLVSSGLLVLIACFVLLALSVLGISNQREIQQKSVVAQMVAAHLDSTLAQAASLGQWAAAGVSGQMLAPGGSTSEAVLTSYQSRMIPWSSALLLFERNGTPVVSTAEAVSGGEPHVSRETMDAILGGKPWVADWVRAPSGNFAMVVVPIRGSGVPALGYLGVLVDLSSQVLVRDLGKDSLGATALIDVVNGRGEVLSGYGRNEPRIGPAGHSDLFSGLVAQKGATVSACYDCHATSDGTERRREIMAFAPMESAGWGVLVRQSEDEVLEPNRTLQQEVLALGAAALFFALFMVWLTTRSVLGPIGALTSAALRIAGGDLDQKVEVKGSDEIGDLARTLEAMRARLKQYLDEIRGYNLELNDRVVERTAELERSRDDLKQSRDTMQRLVERLSTLNAMATALNSSLDLDEVLSRALENALRLTGMESGAVYLVDEATGELRLAAHRGISQEAAEVAANLGLSASLCAAAAQTGEPLVVEDTERYARGSRTILVEERMRCMVRLPFKSSSTLLGTVCLGSPNSRSFSKAEMDLLTSVGSQIAVAVEKARLYEEVQRKEKLRGELLQKVISAQEEERKRIARELHDETSQALAALALAVETAASQCASGEDVRPSIERMKRLALGTLEEVHRLIFDLRPTLLDDLGLIAAIRWYAETRLGEAGIRVRLEVAGEERRLGQLIETTLYRVVQEAVNNVANHSGAQSFVATLVLHPDRLSLAMVDDGWGFDSTEVARSADAKRGLGLMGMKERVELLGGTFDIQSELGRGTRIALEVPLESEAEDGR